MTMNKLMIPGHLKGWKHFIEHIRDLNAQGYLDYYIPELKASIGFGEWSEVTRYVVVSITTDHEICAIGLSNKATLRAFLETREGNWELDSLWCDDKPLKVEVKRVTKVEVEFVEEEAN